VLLISKMCDIILLLLATYIIGISWDFLGGLKRF
jgi:hypothetical protein